METAGVILATIPLIITALDKYVEVLDTIHLFRTERYRRYLERFSTLLAAQQASLINSNELALGIEISDEKITHFLSGPSGIDTMCNDPALRPKLQAVLGRDYGTFARVMEDARHLLQEINRRLKEEVPIPPASAQISAMREIRKAKNILSKRKYDQLFGDLDTSINLLKSLADQSKNRQIVASMAQRRGIIRPLAASIHKALLREACWGCSCRDKHSVLLMMDLNFEAKGMSEVVFRIALATVDDPVRPLYHWQEIEIEPSRRPAGSVQILQMCSTLAAMSVMGGD
ncbi:hypothetical protein BJY04DRAFT_213501 [Aspergillus karnatakaensis]|uniref:uncharacterized protein n=1 Tax=Aspergillus karnatakaensis TaxID=1810916 RepID=UPI003CCDD686